MRIFFLQNLKTLHCEHLKMIQFDADFLDQKSQTKENWNSKRSVQISIFSDFRKKMLSLFWEYYRSINVIEFLKQYPSKCWYQWSLISHDNYWNKILPKKTQMNSIWKIMNILGDAEKCILYLDVRALAFEIVMYMYKWKSDHRIISTLNVV